MPAVAGDQNEPVANSRRGDQEIGIRDQLSLPAKLTTEFSEARRHAPIYSENAHTFEEGFECLSWCRLGSVP